MRIEAACEALRGWKLMHAVQAQDFAALKVDIDQGMADLAAGRVKDFEVNRIVEHWKKRSPRRSSSGRWMRPKPLLRKFGPLSGGVLRWECIAPAVSTGFGRSAPQNVSAVVPANAALMLR